MKRLSKVLTVLLPEMLRIYRAYRETRSLETLQRYGDSQARALGISTEKDVDRVIQEFRRDP